MMKLQLRHDAICQEHDRYQTFCHHQPLSRDNATIVTDYFDEGITDADIPILSELWEQTGDIATASRI